MGKFGPDFFKNIGLGDEVLVLKCFDNMVCKMFINLISNGLLDRCAIAMCVSK